MFKRAKKTIPRSRLLRERANMSFFIVIMFFAVFGVIVLTEIFLIDERGRGQGVLVRHGRSGGRHQSFGDRPDYEDPQSLLQGDDYLIYKGAGFDENIGVFIREDRGLRRKAGEALQPLQMDVIKAIPEAQPGAPGPGGVPAGIESRLPPLSPNLTAKDGSWQIVSGTRYKFFVFSAFYDRREERSVRVVGATKTRGPERVWCRLWYSNNGNSSITPHSVSVAAKVKVIRENWNLKYSACFILCPLGMNLSAPTTVSVVSRLRMPPANHILVRNTDQDPDLRNMTNGIPEKLAICVKPLHFNYNQALQMLEFLELNAILGVHHFTLYNHTIGPAVGCILQDYVARGVVTLLPWKLNMVSQKEIRTEGLFAALNDCLYRSMYRYSHTALVDLDEFIIPRHNDTLPQLIKWMGTRMNTRNTGSYSFQNAFFYLQWGDDPTIAKADRLEGGLVTLRKTRRRTKLHPHKQRSKYLCRPEFVVEAGNHFVWEFVPGHGTLNVPPDAAILHHYRVCEFGGDDCIKTASVVDQTAYRYRDRLTERVRAKWNELQAQCDLPDLSGPQETLPKSSTPPNITKSKLKQKPQSKRS
ncbi:uncharacterized protein [Anabrus simplex]|uniref:uncharacterized protein n=1 Tax=Anabrus simplex TaxID=316456 RepID=UPI0034DDAFCE